MRWPVKTNLAALATWAISWVLINTAWIAVGDTQLTGSELAAIANLVPAIAILAIFISRYRTLALVGKIFSAALALSFLLWMILTDPSRSPAVIHILESISGIQNATAEQAAVEIERLPMFYVASASLALTSLVNLLTAQAKGRSREDLDSLQDENRSLWDEQR